MGWCVEGGVFVSFGKFFFFFCLVCVCELGVCF